MAKSKRPAATTPSATPAPAATSPAWFTYFLCTLCGLLIGSSATYLLLATKLQQGSAPAKSSAAAPQTAASPSTAGGSHPPAPELTAGLPPAQADRALGNFYYDHSDWVQAIRFYESAIKQGSDDADIRTDLANAYRFSGRPNEALTLYQLAQKMNPAHEHSLFNQAGLYVEMLGQPLEAIAKWNEYLVRFPQGRNADAARQLIAQTQAQMNGLMPTAPTNPLPGASATKPGDDLLDRLKKLSEPPPKP